MEYDKLIFAPDIVDEALLEEKLTLESCPFGLIDCSKCPGEYCINGLCCYGN